MAKIVPIEADAKEAEVIIGDDDDMDNPGTDIEPIEAIESSQTALAVPNALRRYLNELSKYPLLTREEERETAIKAFDHNDREARQKLVTSNLRLVVKIAMGYRRAHMQMLDLIQEGNAGLVQAVNRFNPYREVKLSTYSAWWIRAYILKFLMDNKSLVRMGTTDAQRRLFFKLRSEAQKLYARTQKFDAKVLAEKIGVQPQDVIDMEQRFSKGDLSLDAPVNDSTNEGTALRHMDTLSSEADDPQMSYEKSQIIQILRKEIVEIEKQLNERDLYIFQNRILADPPVTLQEIGTKFGVTRERARQLESLVLKKIRTKLRSLIASH